MISFLRSSLAVGATLAGAVSQSAPVPMQGSDQAYLILGAPQSGGRPSFRAVIVDGVLRLESPTSAGWYKIPLPIPPIDARPAQPGATRLTIAPGRCRVRGQAARLPDEITLEWDSGRFAGCGGPRPAAAEIAGAVWELVRIGATHAPDTRSPAPTLILGRDGTVDGTLNCNNGGLERRWTSDGTFIGRSRGFTQTAMGCFDAGEAFGRRFWSAVETARSWRRDGGRLYIRFANGTEAELRYLIQ